MRATGVWNVLDQARRINLAADGDAAPVRGTEGQTRRALLQALVAGAAIGTAPEFAHAAAPSGPVVIVGGGIAGLSALWRLTLAGVDAHLYEARPRMGGRMYTARAAGMEPLEIGGQLVNTDHADMHALLKAFNVQVIDRKAEPGKTLLFADGRAIPPTEAVEAMRAIAAQIGADADRMDKDYAKVGPELDRMSFTNYLDKHADKLPAPWVRGLLETTARTEYGVEPGQASAIELIFNLPTLHGDRVEVLAASDERFLIENGTGTLIDAIVARLGKKITTGKAVVAIEQRRGGARVRFADHSVVDASRVIVATPAGITRKIHFDRSLPPLWRGFIDEVALGRCEKVLATVTSRPWEVGIGKGGELWRAEDVGGVSLGWDGGIRPRTGDGSTWTWFLGGAQVGAAAPQEPLDLAKRFAAGVEPAAPGMATATTGARMTGWHRDPQTMGAYVNYGPGQMTRYARMMWTEQDGKVPVPPLSAGAIHFAGEHLSDSYRGYMNGGAQTGRLAAEATIASLAGRRAAA